MTSTASNAEREAVAEFLAGMEAVETVRARELWNLTEERAAEIIQSLGGIGIWREATDWSGLVTQQEILHRQRIELTNAAKRKSEPRHLVSYAGQRDASPELNFSRDRRAVTLARWAGAL